MIPRGAVDELLRRAVFAGLAPSAVAAWGPAGEPPSTEWIGRSLVGSGGRDAGPDTLYDLASLTKPLVTTTLTLLAIRRGLLELDAAVGEVLGGSVDAPVASATIRQLLSHTSGLPAWMPLYALAEGPIYTLSRLLKIDLVGAPGTSVVYSCPGFILLGVILERVLGAPLDLSFRELVTVPLGLNRSIGFVPPPDHPELAGGAATADPEPAMCAEMGFPEGRVPPVRRGLPNDGNARFLNGTAGNSGLFGTAGAVHALASEYVLGDEGLLSRAEKTAAASPAATRDGLVRGLGWQLAESTGCSAGPGLGPRAFGHTGFTGTSVWLDPDPRAVFVLLTNRHHPGYHDVDLHPLRRRFHEVAALELSRR